MTKFKLFIVLTLLTLSVLLIPNLKSADALTEQNGDYVEYYIPFNDILIEDAYYRLALEITDISILINYDIKNGDYYLKLVDFTFKIYENGVVFAEINFNEDESISLTDYLLNGMNYLSFNVSEVGSAYYFELYGCSKDYTKREEILTWTYEIRGQEEDLNIPYIVRMISDNTIFWNDNRQGYREGYDKGYNVGFEDGSRDAYTSGYNKGYQTGLETAENDFDSLFWGIADVPSQVLFSVLSFEIFGVNAFSILFSILTILLIAWLIKRFIA